MKYPKPQKNETILTREIRMSPLLERLFSHYLRHPNDSVAGDIVENYHRERFYRWKAKMVKSD
jgi:hypothetical protein